MKRPLLALAAVTGVVASTYGNAARVAADSTHGRDALVAAEVTPETWRATELAFEAGADYNATGADAVTFDAVFTHESGEKVSRPGFLDGGKTFRVRFAPTKPGRWQTETFCPLRTLTEKREIVKNMRRLGQMSPWRGRILCKRLKRHLR